MCDRILLAQFVVSLAYVAITVSAASCRGNPDPISPDLVVVPPEPLPAPSRKEAARCKQGCARLRQLGCKQGTTDCEVVCGNATANGVEFHALCWAGADTCTACDP